MISKITLRGVGVWLALLPLAVFGILISLLPTVAAGAIQTFRWAWAPSLGVDLAFRVDGLSLIFGLLISGIGVLILVYASGYLKGDPQLGRFYLYLLLFMGAMLGATLADNIITLFVFWELTSLSSYLLIGFKHDKAASRAAALQALVVTGGGGLALMAGLLLLGSVAGSYDMSVLLQRGDVVRAHPLYLPILLLILVGAFTKSAQFPFHFWLPNAMEAPTPVSAYLHSATMVKLGVYLLARLNPVVGDTDAWRLLVTGFGGATFLVGAWLALQQTDLKRLLAYSTVSALGTLVMLLGLGSPLAVKAAVVFLVSHALYKGALFMAAGAVDHETGSRDITQLGGLRRLMPITALAAGLAALSMSGLPPFAGFVGKELIYEVTLDTPGWATTLTGLALIANILTVTAAALVAVRPFWGNPGADLTPHPPSLPGKGESISPPFAGEGSGERSSPPPLAGEGSGERSSPPPFVGEGTGERSSGPPPFAGEGSGERSSSPPPFVGEGTGERSPSPPPFAGEGSPSLWLGPLVLALAGLAVGIFVGPVGNSLIAPGVSAILGEATTVKLSLWHGLTPMLALSAVTILVGLFVYLAWPRLYASLFTPQSLISNLQSSFGPARGYESALAGMVRLAETQTRLLQSGYLRIYLLVTVLTTVTIVGYTLSATLRGSGVQPTGVGFVLDQHIVSFGPIRGYELIPIALMILGSLYVVRARSRLAAVAALGVVGYSVALIFILYGAPDLAMTQFAIETLSVILFVLVLYRLPRFITLSPARDRLRDAIVALAAGALMTLLVLVATASPLISRLTPYFVANSYPLAQGRNIVNVILVDFRGFDTLGEITVLAVAALGVFALLRLRPKE